MTLERHTHRHVVAIQRQRRSQRSRAGSRYCPHLFEHLLIVGQRVPARRRFRRGDHQAVDTESGRGVAQVEEAPDQQRGADHEDQGQCGFANHQRVPQPLAPAALAGSPTFFQHLLHIRRHRRERRGNPEDHSGSQRNQGGKCQHGATPTTVYTSPSSRTVFPATPGSPPKRRRHKA